MSVSSPGAPRCTVRPASDATGRWQVSSSGGEEPKWSKDGRQLYFRNGNGLMAVSVGSGASFQPSIPTQLITGVYNLRNESGLSYDVDPKTGGFIMVRVGDEVAGANALRMIRDWLTEVRIKIPK